MRKSLLSDTTVKFHVPIKQIQLLTHLAVCLCRPTMILYGVDNIRDLFGHKVSILVSRAVALDGSLDVLGCERPGLLSAGQFEPDQKEPTVSLGAIAAGHTKTGANSTDSLTRHV